MPATRSTHPLDSIRLVFCLLAVCLTTISTLAEDRVAASSTDAQTEEWFEREIRPLLAERCLSCHSSTLEAPKANLKLDRRDSAIAGGDSGPAIEPGKPHNSLLIQAIRGEGMDRMPPDKPLTKPEITLLEKWIARGAPWPQRAATSAATGPEWLKQRAATHWSWQPMRDSVPPEVRNSMWTRVALDRYILSKLDSLAIEPTSDATPSQQLRRLAFDLTGLPPSDRLIDRFANLSDSRSLSFEEAYQETLEELLASPEFGVTWGRHWFDLVRYCETLGHEFDYPVRHAWRYRDAVIDAFNSDLSYATLISEHIAGDCVSEPRRHPVSGVNQSIALTGWWWMGEGLHAPVDVWGDEATRLDNQIDVYSKAFLGLTVACARCHDHKFDAISSADYTSLMGILQSSRRSYAIDDPHQRIAKHNQHLSAALSKSIAAIEQSKPVPTSEATAHRAALSWIDQILQAMRADLEASRKLVNTAHPMYPLLLLAEAKDDAELEQKIKRARDTMQTQQREFDAWLKESPQLADFSHGLPNGWYVEAAHPEIAAACATPPKLSLLDPAGAMPSRTGIFSSHAWGRQQQLALRSPTFDVTHPVIALRMRGKSAQSTIIVDNYFMIEFHGLLFGDLKKPIDQPIDAGWVVHHGDLKKYLGHPGYVSIEDDENGWFELQEVRLSHSPPPLAPSATALECLRAATSSEELKSAIAKQLCQARDGQCKSAVEITRAAIMLSAHLKQTSLLDWDARSDVVELQKLAESTPPPVRLISIRDGTPRDAQQQVRGNPHQRGASQPRCDLAALGGSTVADPQSSGRRELAQSLTSGQHPLASRIMVNRIWLQLLGAGLVDSPDNFGLLGGAPSHRELLDYLSLRFIEHDWSIKWLVREICSSRTYRLASTPSSVQRDADPNARYLSHRLVRRLSAEKLRDTLLFVSGSLDLAQGGESIKVYLTEQMSGRGRPSASGPIDGAGRRAAFIETRRNFLDPFLVAFDQPPPATTVGKRNLSNVPAQALSMLNDPLVHELAERWSQRLMSHCATPGERVRTLIRAAYSRMPSQAELEICGEILGNSEDPAALTNLVHVILCSKEFQYLQ